MPRSLKFYATLFFLSAMLVPAAWAQSNARIVRISDVEGQVEFDAGNGYESATVNVPITEGARLATREDGWAEVQFEDGSTLRLAPDSEIVFSELKFSDGGATLTSLDVVQGEAEFEIAYEERGSFQINAQKKSILLNKSGRFRVRSDSSNPLELVVWEGEVGIQDPDSANEVSVFNNETFVLNPSDASLYDLEKGAAVDDLDQWSTQRDDYLSKNASADDSHTKSPYKYGESDLDSDGQYYDVPDYGSLWRPNNVGLDWDPFSNGYWYQSPVGYTWVSAYRWGWMPYRYGRWIFVNGRGWFWEPGSWHGWHRIPPVFNPPPRFRKPPVPPPGVTPNPNKIAGGPGPVRPPDHKIYPRRLGPPERRAGNPPQATPGPKGYPRRMPPSEEKIAGAPPQPGPETRIVPGRMLPPEDRRRVDPPQSPPDARVAPGRVSPPEDRRRVDPPQSPPAPVKSYSPPSQPPTPAPAPTRSYSPPAQSSTPPSHQETRTAPAQSSSKSDNDSGKPKH
jgi:hypothetical protein